MTKPIVVGFCGLKGHGKDTAAQVLIDYYGFHRVSFADGLKTALSVALKKPIEFFNDPALKETIHEPSGKTYREWMQICGTEWFRTMWADVWTEWWKAEIIDKGYTRVVTTDVRFENEIKYVRQFDSMMIRVHNPNKLASGDTHESERYALTLPVDVDISNNADIGTLRLRTVTAVQNIWSLNPL